MAWIGPRPEVPEFVDTNDPLWKQVLLLKPGSGGRRDFAFRNEEQLLAAAQIRQDYYRREILPRKLRMSIEHSLGGLLSMTSARNSLSQALPLTTPKLPR